MADLLSQVSDWLYVYMYVCMYVVYKANWLTTLNVCMCACLYVAGERKRSGGRGAGRGQGGAAPDSEEK